jgi:hypothetical protein
MHVRLTGAILGAGLLMVGCGQTSPAPQEPPGSVAAATLRVSGSRLVNARGEAVVLRGVDRSGTEYRCVQGHGIFAGPDGRGSVIAMKKWRINAVRLPLNEACWNAEPYVSKADAGAKYRQAIKTYVHLLTTAGIMVILDLHWTDGRYTGQSSGCASAEALCQKPMPDAAQSVPFWRSVALTFRSNRAVIFDLFNEPYPERALPTASAAWLCWLRGGAWCKPWISYPVAGMQTLLTTVRRTGARNIVMVAGLDYANDLSQWLRYEPRDPDHNLVASWHSYNFNSCAFRSCWAAEVAPVAARVPVIASEIGERGCDESYLDRLMNWLDSESISYLAWSWTVGPRCSTAPKLITSYAGTPTAYGAVYRAHLRANDHRGQEPRQRQGTDPQPSPGCC